MGNGYCESNITYHKRLTNLFKTGKISTSDWARAVEAILHLDLPWRTLRSRLARLTPDGSLEYMSCFEDLQIEKPIKEASSILLSF